MIKLFRSAIYAGIAIGSAAFGYLAANIQPDIYGPLVGAILFSFGLLTVVEYKIKLFTGTAGFINKNQVSDLLVVLFGNIIGCLLMALITKVSPLDIEAAAYKVIDLRMKTGALGCGVLAIGCGFIMTTVVSFARKKQYLPLLFGVPLFIVCGFTHCVADAFTYLSLPTDFLLENAAQILTIYISIVIGNFVGCNLYRIILKKEQYTLE